jgi:hypothetical protein
MWVFSCQTKLKILARFSRRPKRGAQLSTGLGKPKVATAFAFEISFRKHPIVLLTELFDEVLGNS